MKMPFEWVVGDSSKGLHGDRAHVYDETGHRELHHVKGHYSCPIFITLHKDQEVSASTAYEDELLDPSNVHWFTRSRRTLATPEVRSIIQNEVDIHVFVKKDDAEGADFYYLGQAHASNPVQTTMPDKDGTPLDVVHMNLRLEAAMPHALYAYFHPVLK